MFTLVVKGNRFDAAKAASDRSIPFAFQCELEYGSGIQTVGVTQASHESVMAWFCEESSFDAPYASGSLLHYTDMTEGRSIASTVSMTHSS